MGLSAASAASAASVRRVPLASFVLAVLCVLTATASNCVWAGDSLGPNALVSSALESAAVPRPAGRLELERVNPVVEAPTGTTARLYRVDPSAQAQNSEELRSRLWLGNRHGSIGAGADWAATPAGINLRPLRPVLGVRTDLSMQTRLVYEVRGAAAPVSGINLPGATENEVRLALEFKPAHNPAQNFSNGLFRVQLSNTSMLQLRPRSGGMVMSYRSQF